MLLVFPGLARWRAGLTAVALACTWPLTSPAAVDLPNTEPLDWRQANDTVGRFLRGHIDLLKTEPDTAPQAPETGPPLALDQAMSLALARRPDLFERPGLALGEQQAQRREVLALRLRVQALWSRAVLAASTARLSEEAAAAAHTGAELGRRMAQVGHWSRAQWQQEHAAWLDAQMAHDQAQRQAHASRETLVRALALAGPATKMGLPTRLPPAPALPTLPPDPEAAMATLQQQVAQNHPVVWQAHIDAQRLARGVDPARLALARDQLRQAARQATSAGAPMVAIHPAAWAWSPELERALDAELRSEALLATLQSQVREAWQQLQTSQARTAQLSQLLSLQTERLADMQRRYNGMLKSTWDLLASARERLAVEQRLLAAQQQQWLDQATLLHLLAGGEPTATDTSSDTPSDTPAATVRSSPDH